MPNLIWSCEHVYKWGWPSNRMCVCVGGCFFIFNHFTLAQCHFHKSLFCEERLNWRSTLYGLQQPVSQRGAAGARPKNTPYDCNSLLEPEVRGRLKNKRTTTVVKVMGMITSAGQMEGEQTEGADMMKGQASRWRYLCFYCSQAEPPVALHECLLSVGLNMSPNSIFFHKNAICWWHKLSVFFTSTYFPLWVWWADWFCSPHSCHWPPGRSNVPHRARQWTGWPACFPGWWHWVDMHAHRMHTLVSHTRTLHQIHIHYHGTHLTSTLP